MSSSVNQHNTEHQAPAIDPLVRVCRKLAQEVDGVTEDTDLATWIESVMRPLANQAHRAATSADAGGKAYPIHQDLLKAAQAVLSVLGDEDLPDNGELSGAAVSDLLRAAVEQALGYAQQA